MSELTPPRNNVVDFPTRPRETSPMWAVFERWPEQTVHVRVVGAFAAAALFVAASTAGSVRLGGLLVAGAMAVFAGVLGVRLPGDGLGAFLIVRAVLLAAGMALVCGAVLRLTGLV